MRPRHSRQARLAEVGEDGQRRISATACAVRGDGVAARVEARYLAGAGIGRMVLDADAVAGSAKEVDALVEVRAAFDRDRDRDRDPAWSLDLEPAAREVALGAHRALQVLRDAVLPVKAP
jgi:hypothetical protein